MFIGEMGCWLVVLGLYLKRRFFSRSSPAPTLYQAIPTDDTAETSEDDKDWRPLTGWKTTVLALPACCDIIGSTLMNVGLMLVAASIYQMTRGALVLFVGLFSVLFLKRKLFLYHWFSLVVVVLGVAIVGLADVLFGGDKQNKNHTSQGISHWDLKPNDQTDILYQSLSIIPTDLMTTAFHPSVLRTITGILLIAFAQVFTATQFCLEEWILKNYALEPIYLIGWEGVFGFLVTVVAQIILHYTIGTSVKGQGGYFDANTGYKHVLNNRTIMITSVLIMVNINGFSFFGLSVTRSLSATSRSIIDTCRTLFVWIVSLGLGWESFKWLQVMGFGLLVYGTFLFNDLVPPIRLLMPRSKRERQEARGAAGRLLPEEPIGHI